MPSLKREILWAPLSFEPCLDHRRRPGTDSYNRRWTVILQFLNDSRNRTGTNGSDIPGLSTDGE